MSKVLAVANFKGGCGKTTSAIDLAVAFVKLGKKVLAVDSDSQGHLKKGRADKSCAAEETDITT